VYHAFAYRTVPDDEFDLTRRWQMLAKQYSLDLVVCISAAQRRGLLHAEEAKRQKKHDKDLADGFRIGGLGQLLEAMMEADRFIEF
jgi:tRNA 2-thiouridine synthesizing protein D